MPARLSSETSASGARRVKPRIAGSVPQKTKMTQCERMGWAWRATLRADICKFGEDAAEDEIECRLNLVVQEAENAETVVLQQFIAPEHTFIPLRR